MVGTSGKALLRMGVVTAKAFNLPPETVYRAAGTMFDLAITARLHTSQEIIGDLDREGFAQILQDVNRVVLDISEVAAPARLSTLTFVDGRVYVLEALIPTGNASHQTWQVTPA